ncbi:hypothetical protein TSTA_082440 [Talaromyces stipitatus ATCC 10500]|uniref:Plastocyanin-like domain-containing protein n=1 Tax=Talaromyces stipitatus (strain ATCC 10500 / CBS 375.48 / QM 6759 / NRRL 1006) TaxID=441959 RepID=B8M169_TALSN|nr:uncharacterized protein TSTA_082440 [Talaromyces stipitatus ATCC 10500]EED21011.1 hypothetical protein TSTA_082440 [Talaromyces stipitatus ATCC 10500]
MSAAQLAVTSGLFWTINNRTWTETNEHTGDTPYNDTTLTGGKAIPNYDIAFQNDGWDPELNVYAAKMGEVIDIILVNEPAGNFSGYDAHPFHFHGAHV